MANVVALRAKETSAPDNVLRKVPCRPKNRDVRSREHLLPKEVESLMKSTGKVGRHGLRDRTLILVAYRHGLRVSRAGRSEIGSGGIQTRPATRQSAQERFVSHASHRRRRAATAASFEARIPRCAVRLYDLTWGGIDSIDRFEVAGACRSASIGPLSRPSSYALTRHRLLSGK